jgi:hypothetical protein
MQQDKHRNIFVPYPHLRLGAARDRTEEFQASRLQPCLRPSYRSQNIVSSYEAVQEAQLGIGLKLDPHVHLESEFKVSKPSL